MRKNIFVCGVPAKLKNLNKSKKHKKAKKCFADKAILEIANQVFANVEQFLFLLGSSFFPYEFSHRYFY